MLNVQIASSLSDNIAFIISYACSVIIAGYCASWVALKMGDSTPADQGYLTLNPFMHIDLLGFLFMIVYHFGWGRFIPLNPFNITAPYRALKLIIMYCAESLTHWLLSFLGIIGLLLLLGKTAGLAFFAPLYKVFPDSSSYTLAIGLILIAFVIVNSMLFVVTQLININGLIIAWYTHYYPDSPFYLRLLVVALPIAFFILFGSRIMGLVLNITWQLGYNLTTLFF